MNPILLKPEADARSHLALLGRPWRTLPARVADGAMSGDGRMWNCYLHGLFENAPLRQGWLSSLGWRGGGPSPTGLDAAFDRLADAVEAALDMSSWRESYGTADLGASQAPSGRIFAPCATSP